MTSIDLKRMCEAHNLHVSPDALSLYEALHHELGLGEDETDAVIKAVRDAAALQGKCFSAILLASVYRDLLGPDVVVAASSAGYSAYIAIAEMHRRQCREIVIGATIDRYEDLLLATWETYLDSVTSDGAMDFAALVEESARDCVGSRRGRIERELVHELVRRNRRPSLEHHPRLVWMIARHVTRQVGLPDFLTDPRNERDEQLAESFRKRVVERLLPQGYCDECGRAALKYVR